MGMRYREISSHFQLIRVGFVLGVCFGFGSSFFGEHVSLAREVKRETAGKAYAAKNASAKGLIIRREGPVGSPWMVVDDKESLPTGQMLIGLPGAMLDSANGGIHLNMRSDLD